jgi:hypothetical protein
LEGVRVRAELVVAGEEAHFLFLRLDEQDFVERVSVRQRRTQALHGMPRIEQHNRPSIAVCLGEREFRIAIASLGCPDRCTLVHLMRISQKLTALTWMSASFDDNRSCSAGVRRSGSNWTHNHRLAVARDDDAFTAHGCVDELAEL